MFMTKCEYSCPQPTVHKVGDNGGQWRKECVSREDFRLNPSKKRKKGFSPLKI